MTNIFDDKMNILMEVSHKMLIFCTVSRSILVFIIISKSVIEESTILFVIISGFVFV